MGLECTVENALDQATKHLESQERDRLRFALLEAATLVFAANVAADRGEDADSAVKTAVELLTSIDAHISER